MCHKGQAQALSDWYPYYQETFLELLSSKWALGGGLTPGSPKQPKRQSPTPQDSDTTTAGTIY